MVGEIKNAAKQQTVNCRCLILATNFSILSVMPAGNDITGGVLVKKEAGSAMNRPLLLQEQNSRVDLLLFSTSPCLIFLIKPLPGSFRYLLLRTEGSGYSDWQLLLFFSIHLLAGKALPGIFFQIL